MRSAAASAAGSTSSSALATVPSAAAAPAAAPSSLSFLVVAAAGAAGEEAEPAAAVSFSFVAAVCRRVERFVGREGPKARGGEDGFQGRYGAESLTWETQYRYLTHHLTMPPLLDDHGATNAEENDLTDTVLQ